MGRTDVLKILAVLRGAYPQFYRGISHKEAEDTVNLWIDMFCGDDANIVAAAVKALITSDTKGFPPVIGQIKDYMRKITRPNAMTEAEAWGLVSKAIRNSAYDSKQEFDALPRDIQKLVGSPSQLRDWGTMDSETVHSVVASNFQRSYRERKKQRQNYDALPEDVKQIVNQISSGKKMEIEDHEH